MNSTLTRPTDALFLRDVRAGLQRRPKRLPCKYFYDAAGSALFDRICELHEYYVTRTELGIMQERAGELAACLGERCQLVEYGSGSSLKTRLLLDAKPDLASYVPLDISREHLLATARDLKARYPSLPVQPVVADFTKSFRLPPLPAGGRRVIYFPGSTIGNFSPIAAVKLLTEMAEQAGPTGSVLIGVDLKKDPARLHAAYNDAAGVTAAFNLNLLVRINRELGGNFDPNGFWHHALYEPRRGRIEMHLVSRCDQRVRIAGERFTFREGETIQTESSYKYSPRGFAVVARRAGLSVRHSWTDAERLFSVLELVSTCTS